MTDYVIWLDSEKAHIFALRTSGVEKTHIEKRTADHHTHSKRDNPQQGEDHFFHQVAGMIKDADKVLLMGPGLAKNHFKTHLEKHHHGALAKKIVGVENCDHPTDHQVLADSRKFFEKYNLFNDPIRAN